jgi:hypothetical protein
VLSLAAGPSNAGTGKQPVGPGEEIFLSDSLWQFLIENHIIFT